MTDLKSWDELTEQELWTALKRYELEHWTTPEVRRCCRTCAHCVITTKECYEGGTTDIGDLDRELTEEDCSAWTPREGSASPGADQLFSFPLDADWYCPTCDRATRAVFVLAPNQAEADNIRRNGGGLCGECMCDTIIDTHAEVSTQPAHLNKPADPLKTTIQYLPDKDRYRFSDGNNEWELTRRGAADALLTAGESYNLDEVKAHPEQKYYL